MNYPELASPGYQQCQGIAPIEIAAAIVDSHYDHFDLEASRLVDLLLSQETTPDQAAEVEE